MRGLPWLLSTAACYAPHVVPGSPCDDMHPCPSELVCSPAAHTCEPTATTVDGHGSDDGTGGPICYGTGLVRECFPQAPSGNYRVGDSMTVDTASSSACVQMAGACVIAAGHITIESGAELAVTGPNPLVLVSASAIDIAGTLDAASHRSPARTGPAANPSDCPSYTDPTNATGGPGGSFGGRGGTGGSAQIFSAGHTSGPLIVPTVLRGGCPGSPGNPLGGDGGPGGGAVYLIAASQITIDGSIDASGAGGAGGDSDLGGGGGGAGGLIGLDAPTIAVSAAGQLFANGGGGGEGGDAGEHGQAGADPSAANVAAAGGAGATVNGGSGGAGSYGTALGGVTGSGLTTGGGGGGGAGVILVFPKGSLAGAVSPPPT